MRQEVRTVSSWVLVLFLAVPLIAAQQFRIRARVDLVVVPVIVKGREGRPIAGLSKEDFAVFEDGRAQTVTQFSADPVPLSAAVLVDTGLSGKSLSKVQESFPALAGAFSEFDEVAVYRFDKFVVKILDFAKDGLRIGSALETLKTVRSSNPAVPSGPFSQPGPMINGAPIAPSAQVGVPLPAKHSKVLHDAIFTAAMDLEKREQSRRKIVLVISDTSVAEGNDHSFDETVHHLLASGIQVSAVHCDLAILGDLSVLNSYANWTGGDTFFGNSTKSIEDSYAAVVEEARNQYIVGYVSNQELAGTEPVFRQIQINPRKPGRTLHRRGYYQYP